MVPLYIDLRYVIEFYKSRYNVRFLKKVMSKSIPYSIKGWDSFLIKEYGYSIMNFAYCIAELICKLDPKYRCSPDTELPRAVIYGIKEFIKYDAARLKRLKTKIINTLYESLCDYGQLENRGPTRKDRDFIFDIFPEAKSFVERLDKIIRMQKEALNQNPSKRGAPVNVHRKIAFILAQVMRDERGISWKIIAEFMKWFFKKLEMTKYNKILDVEGFSNKSLKKDYYETVKRKKNKSASAWFDWEEEIELERNLFFYKKYNLPSYRIEFKKEYVNMDMPNKDLPLLTFPDGDTYMAGGEAEAYKEQLEKKAEDYEQLLTAAMANLSPQDPPVHLSPADHQAYRKYRAIMLEDEEKIN